MELQFNKTALPCLRQLVGEVQNQEVTQEVRLGDAMPDIGKILACWGQIMIRSKEWRGGEMNVSGGVVVFALYAPEDGSEPRSVEAWLPFQMKWGLPDTQLDGSMIWFSLLRGVDGRTTSARKLMVRANVSIFAQAFEPGEAELYTPGEVPADIQLLKRSYPLKIPKEAGEKTFLLDETLSMSAATPGIDRILRYELQPEIIDQKVMSEKVVFRGVAIVRILYRTEDGELKSWSFEVPFSQYTDLEQEYDQDADARVTMAVTSLELEPTDEDTLLLKAGLIGQYVIYDRPVVELVEDAYSTEREVSPQKQSLSVPMLLDMRRETKRAQAAVEVSDGAQLIDTAFCPGHPRLRQNGDTAEVEQPGTFQILWRDAAGSYSGGTGRWEESWSLPADMDSRLEVISCPSGKTQCSVMGNEASLQADVLTEVLATASQGLTMVSGLEIGEQRMPDPQRPSLILRRAGKERLWDMAKHCGSTVEAIRKANQLTDEPEDGQVLLIPVS